MFVAYNIPPDSLHPAMTDDVFEGRLPYGDYFYYVACDQADVVQSQEKQSDLVSLNRDENGCIDGARVPDSNSGSELGHEVLVGFDKVHIEYGQSMIDYELSMDYDNFNFFREHLNADTKSVQDFMDKTSDSGRLQYKMDNGENWAAIATIQDNELVSAEFEYVKVADGRLIHITSHCRSRDTIVGDVINPWLDLIAKYKDMPLNIFTGAEFW